MKCKQDSEQNVNICKTNVYPAHSCLHNPTRVQCIFAVEPFNFQFSLLLLRCYVLASFAAHLFMRSSFLHVLITNNNNINANNRSFSLSDCAVV